jgi:hypothetical protein
MVLDWTRNVLNYTKKDNNAEAEEETEERSTGGKWTQSVSYNPESEELKITFSNGFTATYDKVSQGEADTIMDGSTTKDGRGNSVGAALHKSGHYSNYK